MINDAAIVGRMVGRNIMYINVDTRLTAAEVGGWDKRHLLGVSTATAHSALTGEFHAFEESGVGELLSQLESAELVVGYNNFGFDYDVLAGCSDIRRERIISLDLMHDLENRCGRRIGFSDVVYATLDLTFEYDSLAMVNFWKCNNLNQLYRANFDFLHILRLLHEYGMRNGCIYYIDRSSKDMNCKIPIPVEWERYDCQSGR